MPLRLIPFFLALAWGLNWPAVRIALDALAPFTLRAVGLGSGALLLLVLAAQQRRPLVPPRAAWPAVLAGGLLTVAVFNLATAWAQLSTSTSRAAVLTFTMPMMSALLAWAWLGERPDRRRTLALLVGMAGVAVLAWPVMQSLRAQGFDARTLRGLLLPLVAAAGWSSGTVLLKRWPVAGDRIAVTAWQLIVGATVGAIGALAIGEPWPAWPPGGRVAAALGFHIVIGTALAYWLWFILAERVSATVSSLTTLMVPVVGVLGAMLLVGDRPSGADWVGFALVLGGAALTVFDLGRPEPTRG
jgi:drug/metabolite transporter (DMT)-like permease